MSKRISKEEIEQAKQDVIEYVVNTIAFEYNENTTVVKNKFLQSQTYKALMNSKYSLYFESEQLVAQLFRYELEGNSIEFNKLLYQ